MRPYERLLHYVKYDTASDGNSETCPSTEKQLVFARVLEQEMREMGLQNVRLDEHGYLYGTVPGNIDNYNGPVLGFIAHMDVVNDVPSWDIKPRIVENYDGGDILLTGSGAVLSPAEFPELNRCKGKSIMVTDGTTLLGADDKAGIAEIVSAVVYLQQHPEIKHGKIRVAFNPDEEIGLGAHHFDVEKFGCDFAYTMDGSEVGEIEFENFNAASAKITINGCSVHPGYAKEKMVNAVRIATELVGMLPADETPETTEGYEGFFHLTNISGTVEKAQLSFIIRDHDREYFESRKSEMTEAVEAINDKYGNIAMLELKDQYYNMREKIEDKMYIIDIAKQAIAQTGAAPKVKAIRGGTDGAQLSFMGLPCPNIFAGGLNFHGPHEFCPVQSLEKAMMTIVNICQIAEQKLGI